MAVECAFAKTGEVLATSEDGGDAQSGEKLAGIGNGFAWVSRDRARTHHAARGFEGQIEHRSEVNVESECAAIFSDHLSVFAEELAIAGGEDVGGGRRRARARRGSGPRGRLRGRRK